MNNLEVENQITNDVSIENKQRNFLQKIKKNISLQPQKEE
jgi:hypothetical protein